jgi:hypothetical protein
MRNENSKSLTIGAIAVALLMAWQMRSHPVGTVKLPEDFEPVQKHQRQPSSKPDGEQPTVKPRSVSDKESLLQAIRATKECYASEKCDFPQTDPKSYEIAVGQALKGLLSDYRTKFGSDLKNAAETQALALEYIKSQDEFLQEQALSMFSSLPISSENIEAITAGLADTTDPLLVDQAMNEMKRYIGTSDEAQVHNYLRELLGRGGVFSSEAAAKKILSFINSQSYGGYEGLARTLPSDSTVGQNLRTALDEYLRLQSGG